MKKLLPLSYKGERNYLHGSDIFNVLSHAGTELAGSADAYVERLAFRRFARMACEVVTEPPGAHASVIGQVRFHRPGKEALEAYLVETNIPVTSRYPFDEARLLSKAVLDLEDRRASLPERSGYTPIEEVIALTKHLNYAVCPDVNGKWVFGQLDLAEPLPKEYREVAIRMKSLIAGRFSVNEIEVDGRTIGTMRFIVGAPE